MLKNVATQNQLIADNIREHGWHCLHVFPTNEEQERFSYSIGFTESFDSPEVLLFGLEHEKAHALLNECAYLFRNGHKITPDAADQNVLSGDYSVVFKLVRPEFFGEYLGTALRYYQDKSFSAAVMFIPDREHHFPWQSGYGDISAQESLAIV